MVSDRAWRRLADLLPGRPGLPGRCAADNRLFIEAVLWIVRAGAPWRDLPPSFGKWTAVYRRFRRWALGGVWQRVADALNGESNGAIYVFLDSTVIRAHQHAAGAKGGSKIKPLAAPEAASQAKFMLPCHMMGFASLPF